MCAVFIKLQISKLVNAILVKRKIAVKDDMNTVVMESESTRRKEVNYIVRC